MQDDNGKFAEIARSLTGNPLGIIGLFIFLVYGVSGLVLGTTAAHLTALERWPLICFLVTYPVLILGTFYWMVTRHFGKLYGPRDFRDEANFLKTISPERQGVILQEKVVEAQNANTVRIESDTALQEGGNLMETTIVAPKSNEPSSSNSHNIVVAMGTSSNVTQSPQGDQPIDTSIHFGRSKNSMAEYLLVEELTFRQLESDFGEPVRRNVVIDLGKALYELDGVIQSSSRFIAIEVKYLNNSLLPSSIMAAAAQLNGALNQVRERVGSGLELSGLVICVTNQIEVSADRVLLLNRRAQAAMSYPCEVRFFNLKQLKERFEVM